jgi:DNA-binding winged helix-turn-helix (wHTH) protein/tetratricopeptide (TPR) repeat protein
VPWLQAGTTNHLAVGLQGETFGTVSQRDARRLIWAFDAMNLMSFGPFVLDRTACRLVERLPNAQDRSIPLRPRALRILTYLVDNPGRIISHSEFLTQLWPDTHVQPELLKGYILDLRTALGDRITPANYIETVRGRGYRFVAPVTVKADVDLERRREADPLVGRAAAAAQLGAALEGAKTGDMQLVFVKGEAGIGKTTLVASFAEAAGSAGAVVATGHCLPGSGETDAYYPVLEILTELSRSPARTRLATSLREFAPTWLVQLPFLAPASGSQLRGQVIGATPHRMVRELCEALHALARTKVHLLILEDIHWADQATLDLVEALANRRPRTQLLVVATLRDPAPTDAAQAAGALAQKCAVYRLAREIRLAPLGFADIQTYLDRLSSAEPPSVLTRHLYRRSEGHPLFLRATLDDLVQRNLIAWSEAGWHLDARFEPDTLRAPPDLVHLIEAEIRNLPEASQNVIEAASLSDGPFSPFIHHVAAGTDEETFETACETLARRGQLIQRGETVELPEGGWAQTYMFRHALFKEVAHDRQGAARQAARHAAIAGRLMRVFAADLTPVAPSLARHFLQARLWPQAIRFLRTSARTAMRRFATREAAGLLEQANGLSRHLPTPDGRETGLSVLDELSRLYMGAFDRRAKATYEQMYQLALTLGRVDVEVRALLGLAYMTSAVDSDRCLELMSQALARSAAIDDPVQRDRVRCSAHGWRNWVLGWSPADVEGFEAAINELEKLDDPLVLAASRFDHGLILLPAARYSDAIETVGRSLSVLVNGVVEAPVDLGFPLWTSRLGIPWGLLSLGRFGEAMAESAAACAAVEANGDVLRSATLRLYRAYMSERMHDYADALARLDEAMATLGEHGLALPPNEVKVEMAIRGLAYLGLGNIDLALKYLRSARAEMEARNTLTSWFWRLAAEWGLTEAHLRAGEIPAAEACGRALVDRAGAIEERSWRGLAAEACARVALAEDDLDAARSWLARAWAEIDGYDTPLVRWRLHAVEAETAERISDGQKAASHRGQWRDQIELLSHSIPDDHPARDKLKDARPFYHLS